MTQPFPNWYCQNFWLPLSLKNINKAALTFEKLKDYNVTCCPKVSVWNFFFLNSQRSLDKTREDKQMCDQCGNYWGIFRNLDRRNQHVLYLHNVVMWQMKMLDHIIKCIQTLCICEVRVQLHKKKKYISYPYIHSYKFFCGVGFLRSK